MNALNRQGVCISVLLFVVATLSFHSNLFRLSDMGWFEAHELPSEQLVYDGILAKEHQVSNASNLGTFVRDEPNSRVKSKHYFDTDSVSAEYRPYISQLGLQGLVYHQLYKLGFTTASRLSVVPSMAMALVCTLFFVVFRRTVGTIPALVFSSVLIASPWVIVFARGVYWSTSLLFLPQLLCVWLFPRMSSSDMKQYLPAVAVIGLAFFLKCLCGFEYLTTLVLSTVAFFVMLAERKAMPLPFIVKRSAVLFVSMVLGFSLAVGAFLGQPPIPGEASQLDNLEVIIKKRISTPDSVAYVSEQEFNEEGLKEKYIASLEANIVPIVIKYFIFPDMLPLTYLVKSPLTEEEALLLRAEFSKLKQARSVGAVSAVMESIDEKDLGVSAIWNAVVKASDPVIFFAFLFVVFRRFSPRDHIGLVIAFLSPLSWFFLVKGHAFYHYHLNYILWYLSFIPMATMLVTERYIKAQSSDSV